MECLSCGWRGEVRGLRDPKFKMQATSVTMEEKACPVCKSIAVEKINPRRRSKLL